MAKTKVIYFQEGDGAVPLIEWFGWTALEGRPEVPSEIGALGANGVRVPEADYLRDIYELRASYQGVHYRMLYFFQAGSAVVVSHGLAKERDVPPREIDLAVKRKRQFETDPNAHTFKATR